MPGTPGRFSLLLYSVAAGVIFEFIDASVRYVRITFGAAGLPETAAAQKMC